MDIGSIVIVDTIRSSADIKSVLEAFGRIRRIEHKENRIGNVQRFLVEFWNPDAAMKACRCPLRDFDVRALSSLPAGTEAFRSGPSSPFQARISTMDPFGVAKIPDYSSTADKVNEAHQTLLQLKSLIRHSELQTHLPTPPPSASYHMAAPMPSFTFPPAPVDAPLLSATDKQSTVSSEANTPTAAYPPVLLISPEAPQDPRSFISAGLPPLQTNLELILYGQKASCDLSMLRDVKDSPSFIIALLIASESDRDKWMIVASFYRRAGMVDAAITVINKMVDVMRKFGMSDRDLRPAFLMLSSCYTELGRKSRTSNGSETEASRSYMEQSRQYLQKVYGCNKPQLAADKGSVVGLSASSTRNRTQSSRPSSSGFESGRMRDRSASGSNNPVAFLLNPHVLRDRQAAHGSEQDAARTAKRALEDDHAQERALRRKLECNIDELEQKLSRAEERESRAREQVRAEVAERRRAERRAEVEEARRLEAERNGVKPLLEEPAGVFQRAASGDASALSSLAS